MNSILFQGIWCIESVYNPAFGSARNSSAGSKPAAVQCHALSKAWPNQPRRNLPMFWWFLPMFAGYLPMFRPSHPKQGFHMIVGCSVYLYNIHLSIILTINLLYAMQHTHTYNIYIYNSTPGSKTQNSKQLPATWCQCPGASLHRNLLEIGCDQALPHTDIAEAPSPVRSHGHHRRWSRASSCARLLGPS